MHPNNDPPFRPQSLAKQRRAVDGFGSRRSIPAQGLTVMRAAPRLQPTGPVQAPAAATQPPVTRKQKIMAWLQVGVIVVVAMIAGLFLQSLPLGEIALLAYGIIAFVRSMPSRTSFIMALIALVFVPLFILSGQAFLAERFAVYAFLLLSIALTSAIIEMWRGRNNNAVNTT